MASLLFETLPKDAFNEDHNDCFHKHRRIVLTFFAEKAIARRISIENMINLTVMLFFEIRLRGYKTFSYSTQLSTKFILLINVKKPTIVDILTFISMINTTSERLQARNCVICWYFSVYEQLKFRAQLS